ncbi:uncharacterized protein B0J16DRAFT_41635 [Fusarium flagelliforme]|uniref:uncharacterized protein n=1 Tax=Fusarium flagelliforme TaxID=2675880 RepID=UPI001E8EE8F5|nr:uncharacterized protein B0J16DRAFT_41635 [Fusarium flagelliforme]KAH7198583.1 hypothetical protein B0J16DRAFT_41635 [Fusarium flagelliforme]
MLLLSLFTPSLTLDSYKRYRFESGHMMNNVDTFLLAFNLVITIYFYAFSFYVSNSTWIDMSRCEQLGRERVHYVEACQQGGQEHAYGHGLNISWTIVRSRCCKNKSLGASILSKDECWKLVECNLRGDHMKIGRTAVLRGWCLRGYSSM